MSVNIGTSVVLENFLARRMKRKHTVTLVRVMGSHCIGGKRLCSSTSCFKTLDKLEASRVTLCGLFLMLFKDVPKVKWN